MVSKTLVSFYFFLVCVCGKIWQDGDKGFKRLNIVDTMFALTVTFPWPCQDAESCKEAEPSDLPWEPEETNIRQRV